MRFSQLLTLSTRMNDLPASESLTEVSRVWEIDCLRGLAVILMLVSNFLFDLYYFYSFGNPESGFLAYFSRFVAGLFLFIVGISLTLSLPKRERWPPRKVWVRCAKIMMVALCVSLATYLAMGENLVLFGILHLISVSVVLGYFFLGRPWLSLFVGIIVLSLGQWIYLFRPGSWWLLCVGLPPLGFYSVDYTPLIPWLGPVLIGIFAGHRLYPKKQTLFAKQANIQNGILQCLSFLGKKSLLIYCLHQPVLWGGFVVYAKLA